MSVLLVFVVGGCVIAVLFHLYSEEVRLRQINEHAEERQRDLEENREWYEWHAKKVKESVSEPEGGWYREWCKEKEPFREREEKSESESEEDENNSHPGPHMGIS